jgi:N-acetylmuramoyl-L-alanine amidase
VPFARAATLVTALAAALVPTGVGAAEVRPEPPPGYVIRVKGVGGDTVVQLVPTEGGGMVRAELLARLLGGTCDSIGVGRWRISLYGTSLEIQDGAPFASYGGFTLPLIEATRVIDGAPHVSLQLFSEIIPRFGIGILWDRERSEVRLFQSIARRSVPTPGAEAPGVTPVVPTPTPVVAAASTRSLPATAPAESASAAPARTSPRNANGLTRRYTVVVDAGHGGRDPGNPGSIVNGRRVREAELTLAMAKRLKAELEKRGIDVVMTRTADTLIGLYDRGPMANAKRGDLFISIHTNAANPAWKNASGVRGFETYFLSTARTEDEARVTSMENDAVRFEGISVNPQKGDPLSFIIADMAQNQHLRESSELAATVQQSLAEVHPGPNRGVKQGGLVVLTQSHMPAVLVEVGYGSNREDATWMASATGQQAAARALAEATIEYLQHFERRTRSSQR